MSVEPGAASRPQPRRRSGLRPRTFTDGLYGEVHLSGWISPLLDTPPFRRLAGVSLSDVPGELLFQHPFPSRLDHVRGVYSLARTARPRDRALHVAALAHDLGHGPLSHLTEPLMIEWLGVDHEQRSVQLLEQVRSALTPAATRQIAWLDWDEVAALMLGQTADGRGALLNGQMDFDNLDYVARFLLAGALATPRYDPRALARQLRPNPLPAPGDHGDAALPSTGVLLLPDGAESAHAWLADRTTLYTWLHEGHRDLAAHAMLSKAVDLAAAANRLPANFFDMTDSAALTFLGRRGQSGQAMLVERVVNDQLYLCVWEAEMPQDSGSAAEVFGHRSDRLALEAVLAAEAGLALSDVVIAAPPPSAYRELPPLLAANVDDRSALDASDAPLDQHTGVLHLFVNPSVGRDYQRRLRMAAERHLGAMGVLPRLSR